MTVEYLVYKAVILGLIILSFILIISLVKSLEAMVRYRGGYL